MLDSINKVMATRNIVWIHDKMNHDKCSHQTYNVDLQCIIAMTKYTVDL